MKRRDLERLLTAIDANTQAQTDLANAITNLTSAVDAAVTAGATATGVPATVVEQAASAVQDQTNRLTATFPPPPPPATAPTPPPTSTTP